MGNDLIVTIVLLAGVPAFALIMYHLGMVAGYEWRKEMESDDGL